MKSLAKVAQPKDIATKEYVDRLLAEKPDQDTIYDDAPITGRVTDLEGKVQALEGKPDNDTIYDDTDVKNRIQALEGRTDNFITGVTASKEGGKTKLTYTRVTGGDVEVEFEDSDTISIGYDDTALKERVFALESKEDKNTEYTAGEGLQLAGTEFTVDATAQLYGEEPKSLNEIANKVKELEGKADQDTTYTNGAGLKLTGTEFDLADDVAVKITDADQATKALTPKVSALEEKVRELEAKPDTDTVYDDTALAGRVTALEQVVPLKKYSTTLTGNSTFTVTHNLNTPTVVTSLWQGDEEVLATITKVDANSLTVDFAEEVTGITIVVIG